MSGSPHASSPQVVQRALLPCSGKVFPARVAVNQADDDVPHDRTPLFDPSVLIPAIRFPVSSRDHENGFVGATEWFRGLCTMKQLHGFAITAVRTSALLAVWCRAQRGQAEYDRLAALYQCWTLKSPARFCLQRSCQGSMPLSVSLGVNLGTRFRPGEPTAGSGSHQSPSRSKNQAACRIRTSRPKACASQSS